MTKPNKKGIREIINCYKRNKVLDKHSQKAAVLSGDEDFLRQLEEVRGQLGAQFFRVKNIPEKRLKKASKNNPLIQCASLDDEKTLLATGYTKPTENGNLQDKIFRRSRVLEAYKLGWQEFCDAWRIYTSWDGKSSTLSRSLYPSVRVGTLERPTLGHREIMISLDEWATGTQVLAKWKQIERLQKEFLKGKAKKASKFARDACWRKLKECGCSTADIADLWRTSFPKEIELLVARSLKKKYSNEIQKGRGGKLLDEQVLLREIEEGKVSEDVNELFRVGMNDYVGRETQSASKTTKCRPPLEDTIRTATERKQKRMGSPRQFASERLPLKITYLK